MKQLIIKTYKNCLIMKKLFTLLGLLVLIFANAVTVNAQTPDATPITDAEVPTGYYFIASTEATAYNITSPYIAANGGTMKLVASTAVTKDYSTSQVGLWYIEKKGTTSDNEPYYYIKSLEGSGYYWSSGPNAPLGGSAGYYNIKQSDDKTGYYFSGNGGGISNKGYVNATSVTAFERNSSGSYNKWKLIPAGFTPQDITINYTAGSRTFSVTKKAKVGDVVSTDLGLDFYSSYNPTSITVAQGTSAYAVTCTSSFPFTEGKYYKVKIRHAGQNDNKNDQADGVYTYRSVVWNGISKGQVSTRDAVTETNNALWTIKFVDGTANEVYLCNALGDQKVTIDNTADRTKAYMTSVGTSFYVKKGNTGSNYTNGFRLAAKTNDKANLNDISGTLGYWTPSNNGDGSKTDEGSTFTIEEVSSCTEQTINTLVATNTANNEQITVSGLNIKEHLTGNTGDKLVCNTFFTTGNLSYDSDTKTLTVSYTPTSSVPYQLSGLGESDAKHWQVIRTRNDANPIKNCYLKMNGDNIQSRNNAIDRTSLSSIKTFTETAADYWAIVPAGNFNQFYLVNKSDETKKAYLANENNGTSVTMSSENATDFYLNAQPTFSGITGGFTIQPNNNVTYAVGDHGSANLCYWRRSDGSALNDAGSIFYTVDLLADCKNIVANTSTYVGGLSTQSIESLNAKTTCADFFTAYEGLLASTESNVYATPDANKLYRITFKRGNVSSALTNSTASASGEVSTEEAQRLITFVNSSTHTPSALVRFVKVDGADGQYYIQDVNSGLYYGYFGSGDYDQNRKLYAVKDKQYAGKYSIHNSINGTVGDVALKDNSVSDDICKQYLWSCGDTESGILNTYNYVKFHSPYNNNATTGDENSIEAGIVLHIQEVSTYPVTLSAAQYASLCLPFSVTLPSTGLTANKVTAVSRDDKSLTLTSVGNTVAKGEPVILNGNAGSYTLTINSTDGTKSEGNILTGTSVKRTGISDTYYALGYKAAEGSDTKTAGFYKVTTTTMPANKAYLLKSSIPAEAQQAMMFSFNFDQTGIHNAISNVVNDAESNVYYDLNGRRVLYPTRGIYVKGNGQKVFIK